MIEVHTGLTGAITLVEAGAAPIFDWTLMTPIEPAMPWTGTFWLAANTMATIGDEETGDIRLVDDDRQRLWSGAIEVTRTVPRLSGDLLVHFAGVGELKCANVTGSQETFVDP